MNLIVGLTFISKLMEVLYPVGLFALIFKRASFYLCTITEYENSSAEFCTCLFHDKQCLDIWQLYDKSCGICRRKMRMLGRVGWFNFTSPLLAFWWFFFFPPLFLVILSFFHFQKLIFHCLFAFKIVCCWPLTSPVNVKVGHRVCIALNK